MTEKIGESLVRIGVMRPDQVKDVLRTQKAGDNRLFGEIAIECGFINDDVLKKYVEAKATWGGRIDMPKQESHCEYRKTCLFYSMKNMTPSNERLKEIYCIEKPQKCAIYQAKATGKPVSITLGPTGRLRS